MRSVASAATRALPRLKPKRVVTVTGNEDWDAQRGFGKDAAMAEMMTLMMVGGSGMEHMKMSPHPASLGTRKGGHPQAGTRMTADPKEGQSSGDPPAGGDRK